VSSERGRPRAIVVVTGSELVRGARHDQNGPFLADELTRLGIEPDRIVVVGDSEAALEQAIRESATADLLVCSGGLGPTHDDRTVEVLARVTGRRLAIRPDLEREIEAVTHRIAERLRLPLESFRDGIAKQAMLPEGAESLGLAGTAPGVLLEDGERIAIALPGPPAELRRLWTVAVEHPGVRRVLSRAAVREHRVLRFYGVSESAVGAAVLEAGGEQPGLDVTICARDGEIHVDAFVEHRGAEAAAGLASHLRERFGRELFATDERPVEELVLDACRERGLTLAAAESCTGGMVGMRLTAIPGSSDVFLGGVVSYADAVKERELGVPHRLLERHGAVSAEVAGAMASGVRRVTGGDVGLAVTGVAGPGGATPGKPVGLVHVHVITPAGDEGRRLELHGDRDGVRRRATAAVLHLTLRLVSQS
jgi:nicotinamide-nucleotide amidase